jgi:hypothetical protein
MVKLRHINSCAETIFGVQLIPLANDERYDLGLIGSVLAIVGARSDAPCPQFVPNIIDSGCYTAEK